MITKCSILNTPDFSSLRVFACLYVQLEVAREPSKKLAGCSRAIASSPQVARAFSRATWALFLVAREDWRATTGLLTSRREKPCDCSRALASKLRATLICNTSYRRPPGRPQPVATHLAPFLDQPRNEQPQTVCLLTPTNRYTHTHPHPPIHPPTGGLR